MTTKTTKERILEEFKKVRTDAISVMFDNPNESGIYPTTDFFNTLDNWLSQKLDELYSSAYALGYKQGKFDVEADKEFNN